MGRRSEEYTRGTLASDAERCVKTYAVEKIHPAHVGWYIYLFLIGIGSIYYLGLTWLLSHGLKCVLVS